MLSNNPSKPSKPSKPFKVLWGNLLLSIQAEAQQFLALNSSSLAELLTFIDFAENLAIAFVEVNFPPDANALVKALQNHPQCQDIQFEVFDFSQQPELRFLRDELIQRLATVPRDQNKKLVLVVRGLERAIGISGNDPPVLQDLNFIRDAYKTSVPHPMLFILPDYAVTRLAKFAPDFWAWRSGVFQFQTMPNTRDFALKFLEPKMVDRRYDKPVSPERIETLERLLMEYHPSGQAIASDNLGTCGDILHQLGVAYLSQNNPKKAGEYLVEALALAEQREDLSLQARVFSDLGEALGRLQHFEMAIASVHLALKIQEQLNDPQGKAESLRIQGNVYYLSKRQEEAIASYDQSIHLNPNDHYAWCFRGGALLELGHYEEAIASFNQSIHLNPDDHFTWVVRSHTLYKLERYEEAVASYNQAIHLNPDDHHAWCFRGAVLHHLERYEEASASYDQSIHLNPDDQYAWILQGRALYDSERYEEAIASYQRSLEISQQIGERNCEAISSFNLAKISSKLGNDQEATQLYQNARQLFQAIGLEEDVKKCENAIASLESSN